MTEYWFDTRDGALLVGEAAYEARQDEAGPDMADVVKLGELLLADEFPFDLESYEKPKPRTWSREDLLELGEWTLRVLANSEASDSSPILTRIHLERLHRLGLGPSRFPLRREFGTIWRLREELGQQSNHCIGKYDDWSRDSYIEYAKEVERMVKGKPRRDDYILVAEQGLGPGISLIDECMAGTAALNELIGYPNIRSWDHDDYVLWGVRAKDANNGSQLTVRMLDVLSKRKRGPSPSVIASPGHFGSLGKFQTLVDEEWARQHVAQETHLHEGLSFYEQLVSQDTEDVLQASTPAEQMAIVARYKIAKKLAPDLAEAQCRAWAVLDTGDFTGRLRNRKIPKGDIEMVAVSFDLFDDLWPMDDYKKYLYVSPEELLPRLLIDRKRDRRRRPDCAESA